VCEAAAQFLRWVSTIYMRGWNLSNLYTTTNLSPSGYNLKERNRSLFLMSVARILRISLDVKYRRPWDRPQVMSNKSPSRIG